MKALKRRERKTAKNLLFRCTEILPEGFRIDLSAAPAEWDAVSRAIGTKRLCAWASAALSAAYETRFQKPFLFSVRCMTFELKYHLNAYLCVKGFRHVRHVSTLLIPKRRLETACRTVELDETDVYRLSQRFAFRYFFGIRKELRRTDRDPYAKKIGSHRVRIPFYRLFSGRRLQSAPDCGMLTVPEQGKEHAHGTDAR
jgi:hypothetical protein